MTDSLVGNKPMQGVQVFAQWTEVDGVTSPIYTTTTDENGVFSIGMMPFTDANGKVRVFDANPNAGGKKNYRMSEKWRVWSINPDTSKYQLLYSQGQEQVTPYKRIYDAAAGSTASIVNDHVKDVEIRYAEVTSDVWRQNATDTPPVVMTIGNRGGYVGGKLFWNNFVAAGANAYADYAKFDPKKGEKDVAIPGVKVYASYLSDYALAKMQEDRALFVSPESSWKATGEIRWAQTTKVDHPDLWRWQNEVLLQEYLLEKIAEDRDLWVAETVVATTDEDGDFEIQFNGTFGRAAGDPGAYNSVLKNTANVTNTVTGEVRPGTQWLGVVAPNSTYGEWERSGLGSGLNLNKAPKHVNTEWMMVTAEPMPGLAVANAFYGNAPKGAVFGSGINNMWGVGSGGAFFDHPGEGSAWDTESVCSPKVPGLPIINDHSRCGIDIAVFVSDLVFDVTPYDSLTNFARPGDTAETTTFGTPGYGGNRFYEIVWVDEDGNEIAGTSTGPVMPNADASLNSNPFTVPATITEVTTYQAQLWVVEEDGTRTQPVPLATDSFTAIPDPVNPNWDDTETPKGTPVDIPNTVEGADVTGLTVEMAEGSNGTVSIAADGTITFTPAPDAKAGDVAQILVKRSGSLENEEGSGSTTTASIVDVVNVTILATDTDVNDPKYENKNAPRGVATSSTPTFDDPNTEVVETKTAAEANVAENGFEITGPAIDGVTIDPNTGTVTFTPAADAEVGSTVTVPVKVTYKDGTTDETDVTFTVVASMADLNTPGYQEETGKPGEEVKIPQTGDADMPTGTEYTTTSPNMSVDLSTGEVTVNVPVDAKDGDVINGTVTVTYPDGSAEDVPVKVKVIKDSDGDGINDNNDLCANTPEGAVVDAHGCSVAPVLGDIPKITGTVGTAIDDIVVPVTNNGKHTGLTCSAEGLPAGLSVAYDADQKACVISGTPTQEVTDRPVTINVVSQPQDATDKVTVHKNTTATIDPAPDTDGDGVPDYKDLCANTPKGAVVDANGCSVAPTVKDAPAITGTVDTAIQEVIVPVVNPGMADISCASPNLPAGLDIKYDEAKGGCVIFGTPTEPADAKPVTVEVNYDPVDGDSTSNPSGTITRNTTATIVDPGTPGANVEIKPFPLGDQTVTIGDPITDVVFKITDKSDNPLVGAVVTVDGLPGDVTFDPATNTISGTPDAVGVYVVTVKAEYGSDAATSTFVINVVDKAPAWADTAETTPGDSVTVPNTGGKPKPGTTIEWTGPGTATIDPNTGDITVTANEDAQPGDKIIVKIKNPDGDVIDEIVVTVVAHPDDDGDGVPNKDDKCANTPAGAIVDANGCSVAPVLDPIGKIEGTVGEAITDIVVPVVNNGKHKDLTCSAVGLPAGLGVVYDAVQEACVISGIPTETVTDQPVTVTVTSQPQDATDKVTDTRSTTATINPSADSDGDGVPDHKDKCPGTPAGATVDANGCSVPPTVEDAPAITGNVGTAIADVVVPVENLGKADIGCFTEQPLPAGLNIKYVEGQGCVISGTPTETAANVPVKVIVKYDPVDGDNTTNPSGKITKDTTATISEAKDSDGDGVPDYQDKCANTPEGAVVDEFGCSVAPTVGNAPEITGTVGEAIADVVVPVKNPGKADITCSSADLPAGLKVAYDAAKGGCVISGTPTEVADAKPVKVTVDYDPVDGDETTNPSGTIEKQTTATISAKDSDGDGVPDDKDLCANTPADAVVDEFGCSVAPTVSDAPAITGTVNVAIAEVIVAVQNPGKADISCTSDDLPAGLKVAYDAAKGGCVISGTPTETADAKSVTVKVNYDPVDGDSTSNPSGTITKKTTATIVDPGSPGADVQIKPFPIPSQTITIGDPIKDVELEITDMSDKAIEGVVVTVEGLPNGVTFDGATTISGTPTAVGVYTVTVTATTPTDPADVAKSVFVINVVPVKVTTVDPQFTNPSADDPANCDVKPYATVTETEGVSYTVTVGDVELTPDADGKYVYEYGQTIVIKATAKDGYALEGETQWTHTAELAPHCIVAPEWNDTTTTPDESVVVPNEGGPIEDGTTVETDGPGDAVIDPDTGDITVTPNEEAKPGDTIEVIVKDPTDKVIDTIVVEIVDPAPEWNDTTTTPDESVVVPNEGGPIEDGTTVETDGPGDAVIDPDSGDITVTPNEEAKPGDTIEVIVKDPTDKVIDTIVVEIVDPTDTDGDGVPDKDDKCADTPAGAKVDQYGCALPGVGKVEDITGTQGKPIDPVIIPVVNPDNQEITSCTVEGLPKGLTVTYDKDKAACVISGTPTESGTWDATPSVHYKDSNGDPQSVAGDPFKVTIKAAVEVVKPKPKKLPSTGVAGGDNPVAGVAGLGLVLTVAAAVAASRRRKS